VRIACLCRCGVHQKRRHLTQIIHSYVHSNARVIALTPSALEYAEFGSEIFCVRDDDSVEI